MASKNNAGIVEQLPVDRLMSEARDLGKALAKHGLDRVGGGLDNVTSKLNDIGGPGVSDVAKGAVVAARGSRSIDCAELAAVADGWNQRVHFCPAGGTHRTTSRAFEYRRTRGARWREDRGHQRVDGVRQLISCRSALPHRRSSP